MAEAPAPAKVGQFDAELCKRMQGSTGTVRRILLDRLLYANEPLTKLLVGQLLGKNSPRKGGRNPLARVPGSENLDWEDALQAGRIGMMKALEGIQIRAQGSTLSYYALRKIHCQLQLLVAKTTVVKVPRRQEGSVHEIHASSYADDDGGMSAWDRMTHEQAEIDRGPGVSHGDLALAMVEASREREDPIVGFVRERLVFGKHLRTPCTTVTGAFERYAIERRQDARPEALRALLKNRGVAQGWMRLPWGGTDGARTRGRVRAFKGVRVQLALIPQ